MSEVKEGKIEVTITHSDEGTKVDFSTNMSLVDMSYWLDHLKFLIVSGEAKPAN